MHTEVKSFLKPNFASYLHLGELDMKGLFHLCSDPDVEEGCLRGSTSGAGPSSTSHGM